MSFEEVLPWAEFSLRLTSADIPQLPQLLDAVPAENVTSMRRALGCIWPRMLWLAPGLHTAEFDASDIIKEVRAHDAFATLMWNLRRRLSMKKGPGDTGASWRVHSATCARDANAS